MFVTVRQSLNYPFVAFGLILLKFTLNTSKLPAKINKGKKNKNKYLFVLLAADCFLHISSAAWIGLQNSWPLFLTIFCFIAVRWLHSFTNLSIWGRMLLSAVWHQTNNYIESMLRINIFKTRWKKSWYDQWWSLQVSPCASCSLPSSSAEELKTALALSTITVLLRHIGVLLNKVENKATNGLQSKL